MYNQINYHKFVDEELNKTGKKILLITEKLMKENTRKFSKFINESFEECYDIYKWRKHADDDYLMNPLKDKFKFSFCIFDSDDEINFINFTSVLEGKLNNHFTFAARKTRGMNLAKYHIIKLCQTGLDNGYTSQLGYWPKNNNRSIILYLKLGWQISHINDAGLLVMEAEHKVLIEKAYRLLTEMKPESLVYA
jgi:hypothetical protein